VPVVRKDLTKAQAEELMAMIRMEKPEAKLQLVPQTNGLFTVNIQDSAPARASAPPRISGDATTPPAAAVASRAKQAYDHLRGEFTHEQAAGLVGNFMQESSENLDPTALNEREGAIGIAQWRLGRRGNLKVFAAQKNTIETDFNVQLEFVTHELKTTETQASAKIKECTTTEDAAIAVRKHYERAQPDHDGNRIAFAQKVAEMFRLT
jgi:Phage tail lysozyme